MHVPHQLIYTWWSLSMNYHAALLPCLFLASLIPHVLQNFSKHHRWCRHLYWVEVPRKEFHILLYYSWIAQMWLKEKKNTLYVDVHDSTSHKYVGEKCWECSGFLSNESFQWWPRTSHYVVTVIYFSDGKGFLNIWYWRWNSDGKPWDSSVSLCCACRLETTQEGILRICIYLQNR